MRHPSIKIKPEDWRQKTAILGMAAKGAYASLLMYTSFAHDRFISGTLDGIARLLAASPLEIENCLNELHEKGVLTITRNGRIIRISEQLKS